MKIMNCKRTSINGKERNFCKGLWTWQRGENKSIIDYCLVIKIMASQVRAVTIDSKLITAGIGSKKKSRDESKQIKQVKERIKVLEREYSELLRRLPPKSPHKQFKPTSKNELKTKTTILEKVALIKEARDGLLKLENYHERQLIFKIKELIRKTGNNSKEY